MAAPPPSPLDGNQVLQHAFIDATGELRVAATIYAQIGQVEVVIDHTEDSIRLGNGTSFLTSTTVSSDIGLDVYIINENLDIRDLSASQDNVAISDGTNQLIVNADGSINVVYNPASSPVTPVNTFNDATSVPTSTDTTVTSYTAPVGKTTYLQKITASGTNIAKYEVKVNGVIVDRKRTYFSGPFDVEFEFSNEVNNGYPLSVGDVVTLVVNHTRAATGDFESRIQSIEI